MPRLSEKGVLLGVSVLQVVTRFLSDMERSNLGPVREAKSVGALAKPRIGSLAFRQWFGDSKVVDRQGKPLKVYHGTPQRFDKFDIGRTTKNFMWGHAMDVTRMGAFFSTERSKAQSFAGDNGCVLPVYLSINRPADLHGGFSNEICEQMYDLLHEWNIDITPPNDMWELFDSGTVGGPEFVAALKALGYDGARIEEDGCEVWVAFESTQIKSAKGNCGAFDPGSPNIYD